MAWGALSKIWLSLLALLCAAVCGPALASAAQSEPICAVRGPADRDLLQWVSSSPNWNCSGDYSDLSAEQIVLRLPVKRSVGRTETTNPRYLIGRNSTFKHLTVLAIDRNGASRQLDYAFAEVKPGLPDLSFSARLPTVNADTRYVYIAVEGATRRSLLVHMHLSAEIPGSAPQDRSTLYLLAALCGMILMPLAFNLAFYRVLKERFLLWHVALSTFAVAQILLTSGLYSLIITLSMTQIRPLNILSFGAMMVTASMFAASFIETDKLPPQLRKLLWLGAAWCALITAIHASQFESLGRYSSDLFYLGSALMLPLFATVIFSAMRRGSRAVWFQFVGWAPLIIVGIIRVFSYFFAGFPQTEANGLFYFGIAFECVATAFGVADRFMTVRRQRDRAVSEARLSEALSERDPLTGLMNRRAIEPRFAELREQGFDTFALVDLDRFKGVNDSHGHAVGDNVLCAVAHALEPDGDVMAMRLGGEEFVLLLRGVDTRERAERRRMAIPARVAAEVPGLDRLVTASMGLIELPHSSQKQATFYELYVRADRLLYEAKAAGRNRAMFERVMVFPERRNHRRPAKMVTG